MLYLVVHLLMNLAILEKKIQLSIKRICLYITLHMSSDDDCVTHKSCDWSLQSMKHLDLDCNLLRVCVVSYSTIFQ